MTKFKARLLTGSMIMVLAPITGQALAQTPPAAEADSEDIIVTAQKREERLLDVPISVAVLQGEQLDAAAGRGVTDALLRVPGVALTESSQAGGTVLTVRGVSSGNPAFSGSSAIAYYVDSVPFALVRSAVLPDPAAYDLDRVEVLRGPQGTLYGASGVGGVVRVLTRDANLKDFEFKMRAAVSTTKAGSENYRGDAAVNIPLVTDKLAVRLVVGYNDLGGYIDNPVKKDVDSQRLANIRLKVNAQLSDRTKVGLSAWFQRNRYDKFSISGESYTSSVEQPQPASTDSDIYGFTIVHEFDTMELKSSTSYIDYQSKSLSSLAEFNPAFFESTLRTDLASRVFAEELVMNSTLEGPWSWSAGAFYRNGKDRSFQEFNFPPADPFTYAYYVDKSKSYALFGEVGRKFLDDKLKLTLGLRYFHDVASTQGTVNDPNKYTSTSKAWTPRAVLAWTPNRDLTFYASYAQGFRSGFPQTELVTKAIPSFPPAKPDRLHNYEIGSKGNLFSNLLYYEAALYYIKWDKVQQIRVVQFGDGLPGPGVINGTSASGIGADAQLSVRPSRGLEIGGSISWNDLTQDADVFDGDVLSIPKGSRLDLSPKYTVGAFAAYSFPLGRGLKGNLSGTFNYTSRQNRDYAIVLHQAQGVTTGAARFSVSSDHWTVTAYVENINNDRHVINSAGNIPDFTQRLRPRTFGLQAEYSF